MKNKKKLILWLIIIVIVVIIAVLWVKKKDNNQVALQDTIRIDVMGEPASLDPALIDGTWGLHIVADLFVGLTERQANGDIKPGIALSWGISKDKKTYTFHLRDDAKWSDGTKVTAQDFEYSIKRALNPAIASPLASLLYVIKGAEDYNTGKGSAEDVAVKALNDDTLQIILKYPASFFLELTSHNIMMPVPQHVVEKYGKQWSTVAHMVSDGAYKLVEWKPKAYIKAVKNDLFYDAKDVKIKNVVYYTQQDEQTALSMYRGKQLDIITLFGSTQYEWLKANMPDQVKVFPYAGTELYAFNINDPKFKDIRVREALNMSVDREFIVSKVIKSGELPAYSFVPQTPGYKQALPGWVNEPMEQRIEQAKKLLNQAGYNDSHSLSFILSYNTSKDHREVAIAVAAMWQKIGFVHVKLYNKDVAVHYADIRAGNYEMGRGAWVADYADPSDFVFLMTSNSADNWSHWKNPNYDKLFWEGMAVDSKAQQMIYYNEAEKVLIASNVIIPLYFYVSRNLVANRVKGWEPNPIDIHLTRFMSLVEQK